MNPNEKVHPIVFFMKFLDGEREAVARIAEVRTKRKNNDYRKNDRRRVQGFHASNSKYGSNKYHKCAYPLHRKDTMSHSTADCKSSRNYLSAAKMGNMNF